MAAIPVVVSTNYPEGGPAQRVRAFAPGEAIPEGGPAIPVYVVSGAELAAGTFVAEGTPEPVDMVAVTGRVVSGQRPIPVVIVSGSFSSSGNALLAENGDALLTEAGDHLVWST